MYEVTLKRAPRRTEVVLGGRETILKILVRGLSGFESEAVDEAFTRPQPPLVKDPDRGSSAPKIPDVNAPAYVEQMRVYGRRISAALVAIAIEASLPDLGQFPATDTTEKRTAWLVKAAEVLRHEFNDAEIDALWAAMHSLGNGDALKQVIGTLLVEIAKDSPVADANPFDIPENYARSENGLLMRAAARFGQDPAVWPKSLAADERMRVLADQLLWQREEDQRTAMLAGIKAALK